MTQTPSAGLSQVSAPAAEPLTLAETKLYLRVEHSQDDTLITNLIAAARRAAEEYTRRSFIQQSWKLVYADYLPLSVFLPRGPVIAVTSVTSYDKSGSPTVQPAALYALSANGRMLECENILLGYRVEVVYSAGYGATAATVPEPLRQGMLSHIAVMYDRRGVDAEAMVPTSSLLNYRGYREMRL